MIFKAGSIQKNSKLLTTNMIYKVIYMNEIITNICGFSDTEFNFEQIKNDPNFVFSPDPNFGTVTLFSADGQVINVNSWVECANYVNGGWSNSLLSQTNYEKYIFFSLIFLSLTIFVVKKLKNKLEI